MIIYIDLLFVLNLWIDFLLLITTNIILKYEVSYRRVFIASLIGSFSTIFILIENVLLLFVFKIILCLVMQLIVNGYKGIKTLIENVFYFYLVSVILAGVVSLFDYKSINFYIYYLLLILFTPIILYINNKQIKKLNVYYKDLYNVTLFYKNKKYLFNAFLDTGNNLFDPYKKRPISLIYSNRIKYNYEDGLLVPIETANYKSILKCIKVDKLVVDNKEIKDAIVGLSNERFKIQDINMILHKDIIGGRK